MRQLEAMVGSVKTLSAEDALADSCFVEDTAVVIGQRALVTRPGAESRRAETGSMAAELRKCGVETVEAGGGATIDGGDVLWSGKELFVGVSSRTNAAGVQALQDAFPDVRVVAVKLLGGLHLKVGTR